MSASRLTGGAVVGALIRRQHLLLCFLHSQRHPVSPFCQPVESHPFLLAVTDSFSPPFILFFYLCTKGLELYIGKYCIRLRYSCRLSDTWRILCTIKLAFSLFFQIMVSKEQRGFFHDPSLFFFSFFLAVVWFLAEKLKQKFSARRSAGNCTDGNWRAAFTPHPPQHHPLPPPASCDPCSLPRWNGLYRVSCCAESTCGSAGTEKKKNRRGIMITQQMHLPLFFRWLEGHCSAFYRTYVASQLTP